MGMTKKFGLKNGLSVQMDYLASLLKVMRNKYNEEYVWGNKKLSDLE